MKWHDVSAILVLSLAALPGPAQTFNVYFGNLHSHTAYSDGTGTPEEAYSHARTVARLDFLLISEHNHASAEGTGNDPKKLHIAKDHELYVGPRSDSLMITAERINQQFSGSFVALYGQEFSTLEGGNHVNVIDVGRVIAESEVPKRDFRKLYDSWLRSNLDSSGSLAIVQFNHPKSFNQDYGMLKYDNVEALLGAASPYVRTIEIINGPHDVKNGGHRVDDIKFRAYLQYLNRGFRLGPTADQDNHFITHGTATDHRTAILATALSKANLLEAIRNFRVYATQDKNLRVWFTVNDKIMGSTVEASPGDALSIQVRLQDADEPKARYRVSLRHDWVGDDVDALTELRGTDTTGDSTVHFDGLQYESGTEYYVVQIVQEGSGEPDQTWTAPVWIVPKTVPSEEHAPDHEDADHTSTPGGSPRPAGGLVWSTRPGSEVYHLFGCRDAELIHPSNRASGSQPPQGRRLHTGCPR